MTRVLALLLFALAACSPAVPPTQEVSSAPTQPVTEVVAATAAPAVSETVPGAAAIAPAERAAWQRLPLVNARTGATFTLADYAGQTVYVEPMATWCTNCRMQFGNVRAAQAQLGAADVVFIGLSVETNISAADLARYAEDNNFPWDFAVMTTEMLAELTNAFGRTVANPPSTPHFIIWPDGTTTPLATGFKSADEIVALVSAQSS